MTRVVDLNADVLAIRRLRAAAALPRFCALCCVLFALLAYALARNGWSAAMWLLCSAAFFVLLAGCIERGARWAFWLLTTLVVVMTIVGIGAIVAGPTTTLERWQGAGGGVLMLTPCWILVTLGWKAHRSGGALSVVHAVTRSRWSRIPREQRSSDALGSFATAVVIYVAGLVPAGLAAVAVGGHVWISALVYWPIAALAGRIWNRGRRQSAMGVHEIRKRDTRPAVLLLRSFADDNLPLEKRYHLLWFLFAADDALTLESFVVDEVWRLGPVLAIGNPSESLNPLGAAREYIPEHRWRSRIQEYLNESAYVVSILGATPGLRWEYQQIEAVGREDRVLVVFPPRPADELQRRWRVFQGILGRAKGIELQWEPFIGVPLLAFFAADAVVLFYCKYRHETAYAAAFVRFFEMTSPGPNQ
jgi:hypothetical protein